MLDWYAVHVRARYEKSVAVIVAYKGIEVCLPLFEKVRRWSDRQKLVEFPTFPGYVFCRFDPRWRTPILETPGVLTTLGTGPDLCPIRPEEMASLRALAAAKAPVEECPFLREGQWVMIESGALRGLCGILQDCKKATRVVVSIELLQRSVSVEINREQVRPIAAPDLAGPFKAIATSR